MSKTDSSFSERPFVLQATFGFPTGIGVRAGYAFIPELGLDAHASTLLVAQDYGFDLVLRPMAKNHTYSPTLRLGMSGMQSNLEPGRWLPTPSASAGFEVRGNHGFTFNVDLGVSAPLRIPNDSSPTQVQWLPSLAMGFGYAF